MKKSFISMSIIAGIMLVSSTILSSCSGSNKNSSENTKDTIRLEYEEYYSNGDLKSIVSFANNEYISVDGKLTITLEPNYRLELCMADRKISIDAYNKYEVEFVFMFLDNMGNIVTTETSMMDLTKVYTYSVNQDDLRISLDNLSGIETAKKILLETNLKEKAAAYSSSSSSSSSESSNESSSDSFGSSDNESNETSEESTSASNTDWDEVLDEYEKYIDQYIALAKKAEAGDMSALAEYPSFLEQAQTTNEKLTKAKGEMSAAQLARYTKITSKMASAAY